jgi:hypothetical protein
LGRTAGVSVEEAPVAEVAMVAVEAMAVVVVRVAVGAGAIKA